MTFWLYGGGCWTYFMAPFPWEKRSFRQVAHQVMRNQYPKPRYKLLSDEVQRDGKALFKPQPRLLVLDLEVEEELDPETDQEVESWVENNQEQEKKTGLSPEQQVEQKKRQNRIRRIWQARPWEEAFVSLDFGTSFSDHGIGPSLGYRMRDFAARLGVGLVSKRQVLGFPASLGADLFVSKRTFFNLGVSYYRGEGERRVQFSNGIQPRVDVKWELLYGRLGGGYVFQFNDSQFPRLVLRAGIGGILSTQLNVTGLQDKQTNLGEPRGILIEEDAIKEDSVAGDDDDFGVFASLSLEFGVKSTQKFLR